MKYSQNFIERKVIKTTKYMWFTATRQEYILKHLNNKNEPKTLFGIGLHKSC